MVLDYRTGAGIGGRSPDWSSISGLDTVEWAEGRSEGGVEG